MISTVILEALVPSWWEIKVAVATTVFVVLAYWYFNEEPATEVGADGSEDDRSLAGKVAC